MKVQALSEVDIEASPENKQVIRRFTFLGNSGIAFTGKEAILLAATTKASQTLSLPPLQTRWASNTASPPK
jgi:hypothetical protein